MKFSGFVVLGILALALLLVFGCVFENAANENGSSADDSATDGGKELGSDDSGAMPDETAAGAPDDMNGLYGEDSGGTEMQGGADDGAGMQDYNSMDSNASGGYGANAVAQDGNSAGSDGNSGDSLGGIYG